MKKMTRMLLIHWHYFVHETIPFSTLNFLTGKNASGKSTIIDAMQVILYGDTSGSFFNKAASGKGTRTLIGYLCGELGDAEDSGFKYLRNGRFTSYIALEFYDDIKKRYFTAGCCFDIYSENDIQKLFFSYDGAFPENEFVTSDVPMNITMLRSFLKTQYAGHSYTSDVGRDFRTNLYGKLGGLRDQFARLMKKAVSFNPNVDIQQFISEFVCDSQQTVDISQMQDNIRSYKRLEQEADILKSRMALLEKISDAHQSFQKHKQDALMYSYLLDRADVEMTAEKLKKENKTKENFTNHIAGLSQIIDAQTERLNALEKERESLIFQLSNNEQAQAIKALEDQIEEKKQQLNLLNSEFMKAQATLSKYIGSWQSGVNQWTEKLSEFSYNGFNPSLQSRIDDMKIEVQYFQEKLYKIHGFESDKISEVGKQGYIDCNTIAYDTSRHAVELSTATKFEQDELVQNRKELQEEQATLEKGLYHFPRDVIELKEAVISKLRVTAKSEVPVVIVAEAAEIRNDRWRNVIEGYLHTQKFYLIVPPEHFQTAVNVYDRIKREKSIYGTGIVDIKKLINLNSKADAGSLAEEIETENKNVRLFLDYTLGRVKKCDRVTDLRKYPTSVTDDGMLYQNFVVRAMNPQRWARPSIGQSAIKRRLESVKQEIKILTERIVNCSTMNQALEKIITLKNLSESDIEHAVTSAKGIGQVPILETDIIQLKKSRDAIDKSAIAAIKNHIELLESHIKSLSNKIDNDKKDYTVENERLRVCTEEKIPRYEQELDDKKSHLDEEYESDWVLQCASLRYERELSSRGSAENIARAFPREKSRAENGQATMWQEVQGLRRDYNNIYKMGYDTEVQGNDAYDDAWLELSENKLPEYIARIEDTRNKAFEQFREDFLSRLAHNIEDARRQIDGLNAALKGSSFGEDTYRFLIVPKPEYKHYYDMIVDPMKLDGGYNLFSEQFNTKYKEEISELFAIITNEEGISKATGSDDYEKRVRMFTDYRTYLSFDLEVTNRDGESQRLSKTMGKKSGGETQTPFYIAVLASFAQLYRVGRDKTSNTVRLIIFDEAFSKMDGERISRSVQLLRQFNFQVILSAPPDKIGDIVPYVDSSLCVLRDGKRTCVRTFDSDVLEELSNE